MKVYDPYSNTFYDNSEKLQTVASDRTYKMRDVTPEEQEFIDKYIKSISKPTGHWIFKHFDEDTGISDSYWCSECDTPLSSVYKNYCSNCGADMRGVRE